MAHSKFFSDVADDIIRAAGVEEAMDRDGMEEEDIPEALAIIRTQIAEMVASVALSALAVPTIRTETMRYTQEFAREEIEAKEQTKAARKRALSLIGRTA